MSTIAAISTGLAAGGIGIVRISGENALNVADSIFKTVQGIELKKLSGYRAAFGRVFFDGKPIDEAVALVFRAPKSYTGEDVVEISCHGTQKRRGSCGAGRIYKACVLKRKDRPHKSRGRYGYYFGSRQGGGRSRFFGT